ncbi:universal stress protein [Salinigranum halophilum]|jgi:nucleotide-binding universal stress UspA family protein|uniref:universal stress protein n=1 Tax=Salinigranum halophilum TaxID=2565931 RepID=UPI001375FF2C|nr:universal stress protein [Salinigranum halophilum]
MYDEVLIPTDGSESAERAAQYATVLAAAYDSTVHVLSVVDERDYDGVEREGADAGKTAAEQQANEAVDAVAALVSRERAGGDRVTTRVTVGVPSEAILAYVDEAGIDLVVMGTHGRTGVERFLIGSVAERVVRHADVPVLTVRAADRLPSWEPIERLLVPTDGSEASFAALSHAFDIAARFDALVEGLAVVDERSKTSVYTVETALEEVVGGLEATAQNATEHLAGRAREHGVDVETSVVDGIPSRTICAHAETSGADLVVLASHGRTGLAHYLLGSVAERVVRNATVPVLTVPAPVRDE